MYYKVVFSILAVTLLSACGATAGTAFRLLPEDTTERRAAAIEQNRVHAARVASGTVQDPYRHMRPYDRY